MYAVDDVVTRTILAAMDGVALRQRVTAHNIANSATPEFRAQKVDFEQSLAQAVRRGRPEDAGLRVADAGSPVKQDGNSVDLTNEMLSLDSAGLQFDALVSALNFKISSMRAALSR